MYKVEIKDLEQAMNALKRSQKAFNQQAITNTTRMEVSNAIKMLDDKYLNIKPVYAR